VGPDATAGGKQQMSAQGRRMVLLYRSSMHACSAMSPEICRGMLVKNAKLRWLNNTLYELDQHQPTTSPHIPCEEDGTTEEQPRTTQYRDGELSPNDIRQHATETTENNKDIRNKMPFIPVTGHTGAPTHLSFETSTPPKVPLRTSNNPTVQNTRAQTPQKNKFDMLAE